MTMDIEDVVAALESAEPAVEEPSADEGQRDQTEPETPQAEPGAQEGTPEGPEGKVNYGALHEERGKRKELEDQLSSATQRMTRMEQTFAKVMKDVSPDEKPARFQSNRHKVPSKRRKPRLTTKTPADICWVRYSNSPNKCRP